jgi:hypothetical protein
VHSLNANTKGCNEKLLTNTGILSYFTANLYRFVTSFCIPLPLMYMRTYKVSLYYTTWTFKSAFITDSDYPFGIFRLFLQWMSFIFLASTVFPLVLVYSACLGLFLTFFCHLSESASCFLV